MEDPQAEAQRLAEQLKAEQEEANSLLKLNMVEEETTQVVKQKKIARNDPCPCGSGKKYKQCCGKSGPKKGAFAS